MEYQLISERYLEVRKVRLQRLTGKGGLSAEDVREFEELEEKMNAGDLGTDWLGAFHLSNDVYLGLLRKVLKAAVEEGEPWAEAKLRAVVAELGIASPMSYLSPWDLTLAELDRHYGVFEEVASHYGAPSKEAA